MEEQVEWYVPVSQVAEMLECHWRDVYVLISKGVLNFIKMPQNKVKVSIKSVYQHLQSKGVEREG